MNIFNSFIDFFGINLITETSTFVDLLNCCIDILVALFIVSFFIKGVFFVCRIGEKF